MKSNTNWLIRVSPKAYKALIRIPAKDRERIIVVIDALPDNWMAGDTQKMRGEENRWRRRVGAYRIFYELMSHDRVIAIVNIERRTSTTYKKRR